LLINRIAFLDDKMQKYGKKTWHLDSFFNVFLFCIYTYIYVIWNCNKRNALLIDTMPKEIETSNVTAWNRQSAFVFVLLIDNLRKCFLLYIVFLFFAFDKRKGIEYHGKQN